jgi:3-hydroxyisobutyrate dehydrogenase
MDRESVGSIRGSDHEKKTNKWRSLSVRGEGVNMSKAAFIGLGAMGSRMAANLIKAGHEVTVCDLAPDAVKKLADIGAKTAASAREAAEGNDFVLTMVRDDEISRKVWLDATTGALAGMKPGAVAIECSTITPAWARELGSAISKAGTAMLKRPYPAAPSRRRMRN